MTRFDYNIHDDCEMVLARVIRPTNIKLIDNRDGLYLFRNQEIRFYNYYWT